MTSGHIHSELSISELRVRAVDLVPERPMQTAAGVLSSTPLVLIDVLTREGIVGRSYLAVRYQPSMCVVLNSPTQRDKELAVPSIAWRERSNRHN